MGEDYFNDGDILSQKYILMKGVILTAVSPLGQHELKQKIADDSYTYT